MLTPYGGVMVSTGNIGQSVKHVVGVDLKKQFANKRKQ